jgi:D-alanyl-D-alanine carboxypeptidase
MPEPASQGCVAAVGATDMRAVGASVAPGTDVSDWMVSWGQAGGGMYSAIADLGTWAGTGLGSRLPPADLAASRLAAPNNPEGSDGLGLSDRGGGRVGHTGQILGRESIVASNTKTGTAFVMIVSETGSFMTAMAVGLQVFPDLKVRREGGTKPGEARDSTLRASRLGLPARELPDGATINIGPPRAPADMRGPRLRTRTLPNRRLVT